MRLKTKLVLAATGVTLLVVLVLSGFFLAELLSQRIEQTVSASEVLANQVRSATRQALESGLADEPPVDRSDAALFAAVTDVLRNDVPLRALMNAIVRYSLTVQDVSVTDAHGFTLASTDPDALNQPIVLRTSLGQVSQGSLSYKWQRVFGAPRVLDIAAPLDRNGKPFSGHTPGCSVDLSQGVFPAGSDQRAGLCGPGYTYAGAVRGPDDQRRSAAA